MSYGQSLAQICSTSLKDKIERRYFIKMYKIMKGLEVLIWKKYLNIKENKREHYFINNRASFKSRR